MRTPKRSSATAAALMLGLALIVATSVMVASARALVEGQVGAAAKTSFYVQATSADIGLTPTLARALASVPGVRAVTEVRATDATVAGAAHQNVDGVDPAAIRDFTRLGLRSRTVASLSSRELLVSQAAAPGHGWHPGQAGRGSFRAA